MTAEAPRLASGVEVLGPAAGSGYRVPPHLVRRGDGQIVQLSPLLAAIAEAIDGQREIGAIADRVEQTHGRALHPDDVAHLVDTKLRPLGLLLRPDGSEPTVRRADPLLGLRGRLRITSPELTRRISGPFLWLHRPAVVAVVLAAFTAVSSWVLLRHGLDTAVDDAMGDPAFLLVFVGLIVASAVFHEIGHASACCYGGARPGPMGVAIYLVWPAFFTDVTDSYRLDRRGRLRVDLGGLYFNAVFTVATAAAWAVTGIEGLLLLVPVQLLQMARQLIPVVRFDGYHVLADLVGVPDLFARIRPTLARAVPWRRDPTPNPLTRRAQIVVVTWVAAVVPVLVVSFGLLLWNLPGLLSASLRSMAAQADLLGDNVAAGRWAAAALGVVAMVTVAFLPLSAVYLSSRLATRGGGKLWTATEDKPALRAAAFASVVAVAALVTPGLLPGGDAPGGDLAGRGVALADGVVTELATGPATRSGPSLDDRAPGAADTDGVGSELAGAADDDSEQRTAPIRAASPATTSASTAPSARPSWPFPFDPPERPGAGDNQALAVSTRDGQQEIALSSSLEWTDGSMLNTNEAWALASCTDCRTTAVAFQIVLATGPTDRVAPVNTAVAFNKDCETCATSAVAVQLAVTLDGEPSGEVRGQLQQLVASVNAKKAAFRGATPGEIRAQLLEAKARALALVEPWVLEPPVEGAAAESATEETTVGRPTDGSPQEVARPSAPEPAPDSPTTTTTTTTAATSPEDPAGGDGGAGDPPPDDDGTTTSTTTTTTTTAPPTTSSTTTTTTEAPPSG